MGFRAVNIKERDFSAAELASIEQLADRKELSGIVSTALHEYFEKHNVPTISSGANSSAERMFIGTESDIDNWLRALKIKYPDMLNYTLKLKKMKMMKLLNIRPYYLDELDDLTKDWKPIDYMDNVDKETGVSTP